MKHVYIKSKINRRKKDFFFCSEMSECWHVGEEIEEKQCTFKHHALIYCFYFILSHNKYRNMFQNQLLSHLSYHFSFGVNVAFIPTSLI